MPYAAEVDGFVLLLEDLDDGGEAVYALDEGVFDGLAEMGCKVEISLGV